MIEGNRNEGRSFLPPSDNPSMVLRNKKVLGEYQDYENQENEKLYCSGDGDVYWSIR